jgi:glycosyltransferase involved in cell wall biosynthesis
VADIVDEIIIVDTGSTDKTVELAKSRGAKVFHFPWIDDFAAARNEALRHATGDWIFWMDADDRLDEENRDKLRVPFAALNKLNPEPLGKMPGTLPERRTPSVNCFSGDYTGSWGT